jgi:carbon starvation protein
MNGVYLIIVAIPVLTLAYLLYGRYLARQWRFDAKNLTPARTVKNNDDFAPTPAWVLFGNHFASIAGAGPITGPIIAAMFGWLPAFLWLLFGSTFFGAVHDMLLTFASVRSRGESVGKIVEQHTGRLGGRILMIFIWLFTILLGAAFTDITVGTFTAAIHSDMTASEKTVAAANASVASTSLCFIAVAMFLGVFSHRRKTNNLSTTVLAIDLLIACIIFGLVVPFPAGRTVWLIIVAGYIYFSSIAPIWLLHQPRNFLNSFLLIGVLIAAIFGVLGAAPKIELPAYINFEVNGLYLFPTLFITVACGAISGFHALVATNTTSHEIINEKHILPVAYGSMMVESLLGVLSLVAVASLAIGGVLPKQVPTRSFAQGVTGFLTTIGLPERISFVIVSLAVSAFVLTTLDAVTRLGRLCLQELFHRTDGSAPSRFVAWFTAPPVASAITVSLIVFLTEIGYESLWRVFGSANYLLATLALFGGALFLKSRRLPYWMVIIPAVAMVATSFTALISTIRRNLIAFDVPGFRWQNQGVQMGLSLLLVVLGLIVTILCARKLWQGNSDSTPNPAPQI